MRNRILFIGDNKETAQTVAQQLECEDTKVYWVTAEEALSGVLTGMYNLVVMDFTDKSDEVWTFINIVNGSVNVPILAL